MDVSNACQCCLRRPPDMDLKTPYSCRDQTEIYSDMLKECFQIHMEHHGADTAGICLVCISRLRDAYDFRLQVQKCQMVLRAHLVKAPADKDGPPKLKLEKMSDDEDNGTIFNTKEELSESEKVKLGGEKSDEPNIFLEVNVEVKPESGSSPKSAEEPEGSTSPEKADGSTQHYCQTCQLQFPDSTLFDEHLKYHANQSPTNVKVHTCDLCMKQFAKKNNLVTHMRTHTGHKPFSCKICFKQFTNKRNMIYHSRSHTGEKPYSCQVCMKPFSNKSSLAIHMRTHAGYKLFSCEVCTKRFTRKNHLIDHMRLHTGEKPFPCGLCPKEFISRCSFLRHCRKKHPVEYEFQIELLL